MKDSVVDFWVKEFGLGFFCVFVFFGLPIVLATYFFEETYEGLNFVNEHFVELILIGIFVTILLTVYFNRGKLKENGRE